MFFLPLRWSASWIFCWAGEALSWVSERLGGWPWKHTYRLYQWLMLTSGDLQIVEQDAPSWRGPWYRGSHDPGGNGGEE